MRAFLLIPLLSATLAAASEVETFTLADGRTLTGFYDAEAKRLTLAGSVKMSIALEPDQIDSRQPADPAALAPKPELTADQKEKRERSAIETSTRLTENRNQELDRHIDRAKKQEQVKQGEIDQTDASIAAARSQADDLRQESSKAESRIRDLEHEIAVAELRVETASVTDRKNDDKDKTAITVTQATLPTARSLVRKLREEFDGLERQRAALDRTIAQLTALRSALVEELDEIVRKHERMQAERAKNDQRLAEYQAALDQPAPGKPEQEPEMDETSAP
jgi:chromosome segregation ATPase